MLVARCRRDANIDLSLLDKHTLFLSLWIRLHYSELFVKCNCILYINIDASTDVKLTKMLSCQLASKCWVPVEGANLDI